MKTEITVVIPCKDDVEVVDCVSSIDRSAFVSIVFNGASRSFINFVISKTAYKGYLIKYYVLRKPNLAWALEYGTRKSQTDIVLYMDSDCRFKEGAILGFERAIKKGDPTDEVYKGDVVFEKGNSYFTEIIAKSRTHHTAEVLTAYKPPLAISKKIARKVGGYFFDKRLIWREDSDFDNRVRRAGIKILHVPKGVIFHKSVSLRTDLRSTFRYGIGLAIANALNIVLTEVPRSTWSTFKSQGFMPALYMILRNRVYDLGYWSMRLKIVIGAYKIRPKRVLPRSI